jgi:hypothetical protein
VLWRAWSFASGLPLGAFAVIAFARDAATARAWAPWGALAGGLLLALATTLLARWRRDEEPERGRHLAMAASAGWLALPAGVAWWLGFAPGRAGWLALCVAALGVALWKGARALGPAGGPPRQAATAALYVVVGALAALVVGALGAALGGAGVSDPNPRLAAVVYDLDAAVATRALPSCAPEPRAVRVLLDRGAHPSLSPDGRTVWFDAAPTEGGGGRQIHRLERADGALACWTCGEKGNNVRPHVGDTGLGLVFDTDRHATWLQPDDTEVYLAATQRAMASRRLTFRAGPDERALLGPGSQFVAWSRRDGGRYEVATAALRSGHGGILLGNVGVLARGGAEWIAPLAWSPDARSLVVGRGNPFAPLAGFVFDPATSVETPLGDGLAPAASFVADGGWLAIATAQGGHWGGALPAVLGFALGPRATALAAHEPLLTNTGVRSGAAAEPGAAAALALPAELAAWGEPTGLALDPDGTRFVLGQRRARAAGVEERLVEVTLSCGGTALANAPGSH